MKTLTIFLLSGLLSLASIPLLAQNYRLFDPSDEYFFQTANGTIYAVDIRKVDSSAGYLSLKSFTTTRFDLSTCPFNPPLVYNPYAPSWIGKEIIEMNNGETLLFNSDDDTILVKTQAGISDEWTFYRNTDWKDAYDSTYYLHIKATVDSIYTGNELGIVDTFKSIRLSVIDSLGNPVILIPTGMTHPLHEERIVISKNHGLITMSNIYPLPASNNYSHLNRVNIGRMTYRYAYWWSVGDIRQTTSTFNDPSIGTVTTYSTRNIIGKSLSSNGDSATYTIQRSSLRIYSSSTDFSVDTVSETHLVTTDYIYNEYPHETIFDTLGHYTGTYYLSLKNDPLYNGKLVLTVPGTQYIVQIADSCYSISPLPGGGSSSYFIVEGLGDFSGGLVYYKRDSVEYGTFYTSIEDPNFMEPTFQLYPNPANNEIRVEFNNTTYEEMSLEIFDLQGKLVSAPFSGGIRSNSMQINVSHLQPGMYLVHVASKNGSKTQKLVIR